MSRRGLGATGCPAVGAVAAMGVSFRGKFVGPFDVPRSDRRDGRCWARELAVLEPVGAAERDGDVCEFDTLVELLCPRVTSAEPPARAKPAASGRRKRIRAISSCSSLSLLSRLASLHLASPAEGAVPTAVRSSAGSTRSFHRSLSKAPSTTSTMSSGVPSRRTIS